MVMLAMGTSLLDCQSCQGEGCHNNLGRCMLRSIMVSTVETFEKKPDKETGALPNCQCLLGGPKTVVSLVRG